MSFVTIKRTRLHKFHKNVISFLQEIGSFFGRMEALKQFRVGDRVNSNRGPPRDGEDVERPARSALHAEPDEVRRLGRDGSGHLVFPATVKEVLPDGSLKLAYRDTNDVLIGEGCEMPDWVTPRVQMPWHPSHLKEALVIMLRRNIGDAEF